MQPATLRNSDLATLADVLKQENATKWDIVAPSSSLQLVEGNLVVATTEALIREDGVETLERPVTLTVGQVAGENLADRLDIPRSYFRRMATDHIPLLDANVNGWLERDERAHFVRALRDGDSDTGFVRAVVSDRYRVIDNFDVLLAALEGIKDTGIDVTVDGCDLTEQRMYVKLHSPEVAVAAEKLVGRYRDPASGVSGRDYPLVWAGLVITNSEVGRGRFKIVPRLVFQVCTNGMTRAKDAHSSVHLGGRLDEGVIDWSAETQAKQVEVIKLQARDAVTTFLSPGYVEGVVNELEGHAGTPLEKPVEAVQQVVKVLRYSDEQTSSILSSFISGGDTSRLGVAQAITAAARHERDADTAAAMEEDAWKALDLLAA